MSPLIKRLATTAIAPIFAVAATASCTEAPRYNLEVLVQVSVCLDSGRPCFLLGIPIAAVTIESAGRRVAQATTNEQGMALVEIPTGLKDTKAVASAPLLRGGTVETAVPPSGHGGITSISLTGPLTDQVQLGQ